MATWKGKTKGNLLGYKIFVFILKLLGVIPAYFVLRFVALYFLFFSKESTQSSFFVFHRILKYKKRTAYLKVYLSYFLLGQTLLDKVALMAGLKTKISFDFDGENFLHEMVKNQTGGILMSAHMGNWDIAGFLLKRLGAKINVVMFDGEHEQIKEYMKDVVGELNFNIIAIKDDFSHIMKLHEALSNKELICIHGDRFLPDAKVSELNFMGEKAEFPISPFALAARFNVPVSFVYAVKEGSKHYHLSATKPIQTRDKNELMKSYVKSLEHMLLKYPTQWFNYYPFWKIQKNKSA